MSDFEDGLNDGQAVMLYRIIRIIKAEQKKTTPNSGAGRQLKDLLRILSNLDSPAQSPLSPNLTLDKTIEGLDKWFDEYMPKGTVKPNKKTDAVTAEVMTKMMQYWRNNAKSALTKTVNHLITQARKEANEQGFYAGCGISGVELYAVPDLYKKYRKALESGEYHDRIVELQNEQ